VQELLQPILVTCPYLKSGMLDIVKYRMIDKKGPIPDTLSSGNRGLNLKRK